MITTTTGIPAFDNADAVLPRPAAPISGYVQGRGLPRGGAPVWLRERGLTPSVPLTDSSSPVPLV